MGFLNNIAKRKKAYLQKDADFRLYRRRDKKLDEAIKHGGKVTEAQKKALRTVKSQKDTKPRKKPKLIARRDKINKMNKGY